MANRSENGKLIFEVKVKVKRRGDESEIERNNVSNVVFFYWKLLANIPWTCASEMPVLL